MQIHTNSNRSSSLNVFFFFLQLGWSLLSCIPSQTLVISRRRNGTDSHSRAKERLFYINTQQTISDPCKKSLTAFIPVPRKDSDIECHGLYIDYHYTNTTMLSLLTPLHQLVPAHFLFDVSERRPGELLAHTAAPFLCVWPGILSDCGQGHRTPCKIPTTYIWGAGGWGYGGWGTGFEITSSKPIRPGFDEAVTRFSLSKVEFHPTSSHLRSLDCISIQKIRLVCCSFPTPPPTPPHPSKKTSSYARLIVRSLHNLKEFSLITQHTTNIGSLTIPPSKKIFF